MIRKLKNGNTLITLGEGTVYTGNVSEKDSDKPFGIYFTNKKGKSTDAVIIHLPSEKAIASYVMALVRFLEAHVEEGEFEEVFESIQQLKHDLEPMLPEENFINPS